MIGFTENQNFTMIFWLFMKKFDFLYLITLHGCKQTGQLHVKEVVFDSGKWQLFLDFIALTLISC